MKLDFYHNKIVADNVTSEFEDGFRKELLPLLDEKYGGILEIQMYEDYIADEFTLDGYWYYPLTVLIASGPTTQWVRWPVNKENFEDGVPYSFIGRGRVGFELCDAPAGFEEKLSGRARYCSEGSVKVRVEIVGGDSVRLSGKYSQTFIDEMARQLTSAIESATGVTGIAGSSVELVIVFAPGTYMEHTSENITYRRLMLLDKVSAPRDFWIQWTRLDGAVAYSVSSHVNGENILFELGEDVDQKIREKEYRYLLSSGKDKYHNSMGRKKVTEWREVIKRAAKRGELSKVETDYDLAPETLELEERIADLLGKRPADRGGYEKEEIPFISVEDDEFERAMEKARMVVERIAEEREDDALPVFEMISETEVEEISEEIAEPFEDLPSPEEEIDIELEAEQLSEDADEEALADLRALEPDGDVFEICDGEDEEFEETEEPLAIEIEDEEPEEAEESETMEIENEDTEEADEISAIPEEESLPDEEIQSMEEILAGLNLVSLDETESEEALEEEADAGVSDELAEEPSPAEDAACETAASDDSVIEATVSPNEGRPAEVRYTHTGIAERVADIRAELETKIRLEYESRARIKAEQELIALRREQQKLKLENEAIVAEAKKEQERLRREYEILLEQTEREAARREAEEAQRRAEEEELRAQIEMQLRAEARERERLAEAARMAIEEQHRLEAENARIARQREEEERIEAEKRRREEQERQLEDLRQAELERIRREDEEAKERARNAMPDMGDGRYAYTSKSVKLLFRKSVDPNITTRIYEIMKATVEYYGKDRVYLKIKATVADTQTVVLDFEQIPIEEMELLGNIIKILGNSGLGIAKAIIE